MVDYKQFSIVTATILLLTACLFIGAYAKQEASLPTLTLKLYETYRGYNIYVVEGYNDDYYLLQSPSGLCEVYVNLSDLKADINRENP